jgi:hypothetical protein
MDTQLARAWQRGAIALAVPGICLFALGLTLVARVGSRTLGDARTVGIVTNLNLTNNRGSRPTIEYAVAGKTYQVETLALYSAESFALGQNVTVHYPPERPDLGMLDSFREHWPLPIFLSIVSLVLLVLAWKARTGLPPILHSISGFALAVLGAVLGMTLFSLLCVPGGLEVFAGAPWLVTLLGGALIFFGTIPIAALGSLALWQAYVPARCPRCRGGTRMHFVGKQITYRCASCNHQT